MGFTPVELRESKLTNGRIADSMHSVVCAACFQIEGNSRYFRAYLPTNGGDCVMNVHTDEGWIIAGFLKPDRNKLIMSVMLHGIKVKSIIACKSIKLYGEKLPYHTR